LSSSVHRRLAAGVVAALCACQALAEAVPSSNALALRQAVEAAWQHRVAAHASQDRLRRAQASGLAARGWLPDPPALEVSQRSDRWHANHGAQEREIGLTLPLWLPGQRSARIAAAEAELAWAQASEAADKLKLAGEVRERAWELSAAQAQLRQAEIQAEVLRALAGDGMRRVKAGELARTEQLDLHAEALAAEAAVHEARARFAAAQAQWSALTGQPAWPDAPEAPQDAPASAHPALKAAELAVQRASRALDDAQRSSREAPELALGLRRDRAERSEPRQSSVVLGLRWAFGTDARNEPRLAAALGELEAARAEALTLQQQLNAERAAAGAALAAAQAQLAAARQRADLLQQRAALFDAAGKAGEAGLPERLRARAAAAQSVAAVAQQQAAVGLARARLHQAMGVFP